MPHLTRRQLLQITALSLLTLNACSRKKYSAIARNSKVLALGDSLTAGYGAPEGSDYPNQLAQITGWQIINGGISGDTSAQAMARLTTLLKEEPKLVLMSIGGNDFLRKLPESETRQNIAQMIETIKQKKIPVVLVAIPHFTLGALLGNVSDHPLYQDLARQHSVPLLSEAWADILGDKDLKSDQVHANAAGYRQFAEEMAGFLKKQGFYRE